MTVGSHCRLPGAPFLVLAVSLLLFLATVRAGSPQGRPLFTIDEDCTAFTFGRDGKIAFAVHHVFSRHKFDVQRDDFWISDAGHGKHRILNGDKLDRGEGGFSYTVRSLRWSPGETKLAAEVMVSTQAERHGNAQSAVQSFLLDRNGQEIKVADGDSFIPDSQNPAWLGDEATVVYLSPQPKPRKELAIWSVRPAAGHAERLFLDTYFLGAAWMERTQQAIAVTAPERGEKPRLVLLDLAHQSSKDLATLDGYDSGLSLSPSGRKVAYFRDPGTLEVRTLTEPQAPHRVQALVGRYFWTSDEQHVILKSEPGQRSSILEMLRLSDGSTDDLFNALTFWNFGVSPDGTRLGVSPPGKHVVEVYDMPPQH
jgi:hypothetical protein